MARLAYGALLATAFALAPVIVCAQERGPPLSRLDWQAPFLVEADGISVNHKTRTATFTGHVVAIRGEERLKCSRLVARYHSAKANSQIVSLECEPNDLRLID